MQINKIIYFLLIAATISLFLLQSAICEADDSNDNASSFVQQQKQIITQSQENFQEQINQQTNNISNTVNQSVSQATNTAKNQLSSSSVNNNSSSNNTTNSTTNNSSANTSNIANNNPNPASTPSCNCNDPNDSNNFPSNFLFGQDGSKLFRRNPFCQCTNSSATGPSSTTTNSQLEQAVNSPIISTSAGSEGTSNSNSNSQSTPTWKIPY